MADAKNLKYLWEQIVRYIGVGTMGAVGAAAPTISSQWVQTMYSAPTIFWNKNTVFITESQQTSCLMNKFRNTLANITVNVATNVEKTSDTGFITVAYCLWNLGIPSPERHQQRRVLNSASCTHNIPDVSTPVVR